MEIGFRLVRHAQQVRQLVEVGEGVLRREQALVQMELRQERAHVARDTYAAHEPWQEHRLRLKARRQGGEAQIGGRVLAECLGRYRRHTAWGNGPRVGAGVPVRGVQPFGVIVEERAESLRRERGWPEARPRVEIHPEVV